MRLLVPLLLTALLAGCAAVPSVDFHRLAAGSHPDTWTLFQLTDTVMVVGSPTGVSDSGKADGLSPPVSLSDSSMDCTDKGCGRLAVVAVPISSDRELLAIEPRTRHLVSTSLSATYLPNSLRLKVLSIEAKDHRLEAINTLGALIKGGEALATARSSGDATATRHRLVLPVILDLADARKAQATPQRLPLNSDWTYQLTFLDDPAGLGLVPHDRMGEVHKAMIVSACRRVRLRLAWADGGAPAVVLETSVADPEWLATYPFPSKGALTFHSLCGVDIQAQAVTDVTTDALATAFFNDVSQLRASKPH